MTNFMANTTPCDSCGEEYTSHQSPVCPHPRLAATKDIREEIRKKIYDIVLAARTEGIIPGKTKRFAKGDAEDIFALFKGLAQVPDESELPKWPIKEPFSIDGRHTKEVYERTQQDSLKAIEGQIGRFK